MATRLTKLSFIRTSHVSLLVSGMPMEAPKVVLQPNTKEAEAGGSSSPKSIVVENVRTLLYCVNSLNCKMIASLCLSYKHRN